MGSVHASEGVGEGSGSWLSAAMEAGPSSESLGVSSVSASVSVSVEPDSSKSEVHCVVGLVGFTGVVAPPVGRPRLRLVLVHGEAFASQPH